MEQKVRVFKNTNIYVLTQDVEQFMKDNKATAKSVSSFKEEEFYVMVVLYEVKEHEVVLPIEVVEHE